MAIASVYHLLVPKQDAFKEEGFIMTRESFSRIRFVHSLIRENASFNNDGYSLSVSDLSHAEKKLFLSHLVSPNDFEYFTENPIREAEALKDYEEEMQFFIEQELSNVYHEDMEERGLIFNRYPNGDFCWERR